MDRTLPDVLTRPLRLRSASGAGSRRHPLARLAIGGAAAFLVGGAVGAGAATTFSDSASLGTTSSKDEITTTRRARPVDLKVAMGTDASPIVCDQAVDNLAAGFRLKLDLDTGLTYWPTSKQRLCISNVGHAATDHVLLSMRPDFTDVEISCTDGEAAVDPTCEPGGTGEAEEVPIEILPLSCSGGPDGGSDGPVAPFAIGSLATTPYDLGPLAATQTRCFTILARTDVADETTLQRAQSDDLRALFDVTATA